MRLIQKSLLFAICCIGGLAGCVGPSAQLLAGQGMAAASGIVRAQQAAGSTPKSDADFQKLELAAPMEGDKFVRLAKQVISRQGYETVSITGFGGTWVVTARRQELSPAIFIFGRTDIQVVTVTMQLEPGGRTISISTNTTDNTGKANPGEVTAAFRGGFQELYVENKR